MKRSLLILFALLKGSLSWATSECALVTSGDCSGPEWLVVPLSRSAGAAQSCMDLPAPCDLKALDDWMRTLLAAQMEAGAGSGALKLRGILVESTIEDVAPQGQFLKLADQRIWVCHRTQAGSSGSVLREVRCPAVKASKKCSHGTLARETACVLPIPLSNPDPLPIFRSLSQAERVFENARRQYADKSELEAEGKVQGPAAPTAPEPGTRASDPDGTSNPPEN